MLASDALDRATGILKFDRTSIGLPGLESTQLLAVLSQANTDWVEAHKKGGGEPPEYMQGEAGGTLVDGTDLDGAVATTDTDIDVTSAANLDSSGAIVVYESEMPDVIFNTGKTSNNLTGVTKISFAHSDGDAVYKLYALPTDFRDFRQEDGYRDGVRVAGSEYRYTNGDPVGGDFTVIDNGGTKYLWFPRDASGDYSIVYNKMTTTIDDEADSVDIPDSESENQWYLVWRVVSYGREVLGVEGVDLAESRATKILADEMKKRSVGKRVRLSRGPIDMGSPYGTSFFNQRAGYRGFYQ